MQKYVIALYIRLSIEDFKYDSMSIENQRLVLNEYAAASCFLLVPVSFSVEFPQKALQEAATDSWIWFSLYRKPQSWFCRLPLLHGRYDGL